MCYCDKHPNIFTRLSAKISAFQLRKPLRLGFRGRAGFDSLVENIFWSSSLLALSSRLSGIYEWCPYLNQSCMWPDRVRRRCCCNARLPLGFWISCPLGWLLDRPIARSSTWASGHRSGFLAKCICAYQRVYVYASFARVAGGKVYAHAPSHYTYGCLRA